MDIVFFFYNEMTALDIVGPHEILSRLPGAKIYRVAEKAGPIHTDSGLILTADCGISAIKKADLLIIPGAGNATTLRTHPNILNWIRSIHKTTTKTASICTGSLILGAARLLSNIRATTHWAALDRLSAWGAIPIQERVVKDGKIITAAGVSAGIDMALLLGEELAGLQWAQTMELALEYDPKPPFDVGSPEKADPTLCAALKTQMTASFESP